jgi:hypothetical protein
MNPVNKVGEPKQKLFQICSFFMGAFESHGYFLILETDLIYIMSDRQTDSLNILLILLSLMISFWLPFELFLFSYAVLGPPHYMTEIDWLNKRNFFVPHREWIWVFVATAGVISLPYIFNLAVFNLLRESKIVRSLIIYSRMLFDNGLLFILIFGGMLAFIKDKGRIPFMLIASAILGTIILKFVPFSAIAISLLLPTLVHVYIFTLIFMIYGVRKSGSREGLLAIVLLLLCPLIIYLPDWHIFNRQYSERALTIFSETGFRRVNMLISETIGGVKQFDPSNTFVLKTQVLIAFTYTYHYLNWFSKTTSIGWSRHISRTRLVIMIGISIVSTLIFWFDYRSGLGALFFLSTLHVLLEFPLNIRSVVGIFSGR